jgi:hypothetical protein
MPVALGLGGLLPFLAAAAGSLLLAQPAAGAAAALAAVYGAVILSFLGGVHWGFGLKGGGPGAFAWAVTPSLIAFLAAFLPLGWMLGALSAGFVLAGAVDVAFFARTGPRWYVRLRIALTLVVVLALSLCAAAAPAGRALIDVGALLSAA